MKQIHNKASYLNLDSKKCGVTKLQRKVCLNIERLAYDEVEPFALVIRRYPFFACGAQRYFVAL